MIGDKIIIRPQYFELSKALIAMFNEQISIEPGKKWVIGIGGESGSGKSVTAKCLAEELERLGFKTLLLHQDDYFVLPPKANHLKRLENPAQVGPSEVRMGLLQRNIDHFHFGLEQIATPEINYYLNSIEEKTQDLADVQVLIVEGTYVMGLGGLDWRIFMGRDYLQTRKKRLKRGREAFDPFIESVLEKEHQIIKPMQKDSHVIINLDYEAVWVGES